VTKTQQKTNLPKSSSNSSCKSQPRSASKRGKNLQLKCITSKNQRKQNSNPNPNQLIRNHTTKSTSVDAVLSIRDKQTGYLNLAKNLRNKTNLTLAKSISHNAKFCTNLHKTTSKRIEQKLDKNSSKSEISVWWVRKSRMSFQSLATTWGCRLRCIEAF
jgi:hypothetical protein